jgi:molybdopterin converting factor small subunit
MTVTVRLFARAKDIAGAEALSLSLPEPATIADVRRRLTAEHPRLEALVARSVFAVGDEFADDACRLPPRAEVALLPPVSGG